jgi:RHS repeat-associated protein
LVVSGSGLPLRLGLGMAGTRLPLGRGVRAFRRDAVSLAVLFGVLVVGSGATAQAVHTSKRHVAKAAVSPVATNGTPVAPNAYVAFSQAAALNRSVIVKDQTTKTTTVYANPSGTLTQTLASGPVQEPDASAPTGYTPIDLTLAQGLSGISPKVADAPITSSDGSTKTAASLAVSDSESVGFSWPTALPTPTLSGDVATYKNVQPGVNLRVQAQTDGYDLQIILTKAPTTAAVFRIPLALKGLTAQRASVTGQLQFASAAGKVEVSGDAPQMWGATNSVTGQPTQTSTPTVSIDTSGATPTLVVTPSAQFLSSAAVAYPVVIDPSANLTTTGDTYVDSFSPTSTHALDTLNKVGLASAGRIQRSLIAFDTSSLSGTDVTSASLNLYEASAPACTPTEVDVYDLSGSWSGATNWNTQPAQNQLRSSQNTDAGGGTGCPAGWISFTGGGSGTNTITGLVNAWAAGTLTNHGVEVVAHDETTTADYKTFNSLNAGSNAPYLAVTYNTPPTLPTSRWPQANEDINDLHVPLSAYFQDPDSDPGQVQFEVDNNTTGALIDTGLGSSVPDGGKSVWHVPSGDLADGGVYKWRDRGYDGTDYGSWSAYRVFTEDVTAPGTPTISSSTDPSQTTWYSSTSISASWTDSDSGTGIAGYAVSLTTSPNSLPSGALQTSTSWSGTATSGSINYLHVRAQDNAGNWGTTATYAFHIGNGSMLTPHSGDSTQQYFTLQASVSSSFTGVTFQWRRSDNDSWASIPTSDVTDTDTSGSVTWPISLTGGVTDHIKWNLTSTLSGVDGPVQIRGFLAGSGGGATNQIKTIYDQNALGSGETGSGATEQVGPGSVALVTGDYSISASDAGEGGLGIDREFDSLFPNATPHGVFGPGWSSTLNLGTYVSLHSGADYSQGNFVTITQADGSEVDFMADGSNYDPVPGSGGYMLTTSGSGSSTTWTLTDPSGTVTTFGLPSGGSVGSSDYYPTSTTPPNTASSNPPTQSFSYSVVSVPGGSQTRPTREVNALPGVSCSSSPTTTAGCQTLTFTYASSTTATGTGSSQWGDFQGQLKSISYTAYDPSSSAMSTVAVEDYQYDSNGRLREEYDPRLSSPLKTTYDYDSSNRVSTVTPPGVNAWTLNYNSSNQLTSTVRSNDPSGTETTTVYYNVPLTGSGAPYSMGASDVAAWAQQDDPATGTAIFPPSEVPSGNPPADYTQATIYYTDGNGQLVNVAAPGGEISTTEYDENGNVVRTLSPLNRQTALAAGSGSAALATTLDTETTYSGDGTDVLESIGPDHQITLDDGMLVDARADTTNTYGTTSTYGQDLLTQTVEGALEDGASTDVQTRTTTFQYSGQSNLGLSLGQPTSVTTDPSGLDLVETTRYDADGNVIATIKPGDPTGGDAHETDTVYYRAGTGSGVTACDSTPQFAGDVCQTAPAAQPSGGLPDVLTTTYTYDLYGDTLTRTDVSGTATRTWTYTYDNAGRLHTTAISGPGTSLPTVTQAYDSGTGLPSTTTDGTDTITATYDNVGRLKTYEDAAGNTSTYSYDTSDRVATSDDGKGTQTYTYQVGSEERGILTKVVDSAAGTFTATYDADGNLVDEVLPNGVDECTTYDPTDDATQLTYQSGGSCGSTGTTTVLDYTQSSSIHDQWLTTTGPSSTGDPATKSYSYDADGRVSEVQDTLGDQCTTRQYGYDADSNRTQYVSTGPGSGGACQTGTLATVHGYDGADRLSDTGIVYDSMGRTTTLPAADAGGTQETLSYYSKDRLNSITQGTVTLTASVDPAWRVDTWVTSADSAATKTNHYAADGDSPAWISENTANTTWTRNIPGIDGLMVAAEASTGSVTYELADLHGDIAATADSSGNLLTTTDYQEFGTPRSGAVGRYGWLGAFQRQSDGLTGSVIMGVRVYSPSIGRFLQVDPVSNGSANAYDYSNQDPITGSDLSGAVPPPAQQCRSKNINISDAFTPQTLSLITYSRKVSISIQAEWCWNGSGIDSVYRAYQIHGVSNTISGDRWKTAVWTLRKLSAGHDRLILVGRWWYDQSLFGNGYNFQSDFINWTEVGLYAGGGCVLSHSVRWPWAAQLLGRPVYIDGETGEGC